MPNPVRKEDAYAFEEYEDLTELGGNPIPMVHTEMLLFAGIQCRPGFHSVTDEMMDAAKHCAGFGSEDKVSKLKFPEEKVLIQLGGTPFLVRLRNDKGMILKLLFCLSSACKLVQFKPLGW